MLVDMKNCARRNAEEFFVKLFEENLLTEIAKKIYQAVQSQPHCLQTNYFYRITYTNCFT